MCSNKLMSFAGIGVLVACFLLIGSAVLVSVTVNNLVKYVEGQNEVVVFLDDGATAKEVEDIGTTLQSLENISQITYRSKADALELEKANAGEYAGLFDDLEEDNPLPDSYIIQVQALDLMEDTAAAIKKVDGVQKVIAQTDVADILSALKNAVNYAGLVVVGILIVVSIVIITNTIKLTVFSRRKEINIMKYVGATDMFIRMPFLVEGMLIGVLAAVLAYSILGIGYTYLLNWTHEHFEEQTMIALVLNSAVSFREISLLILGGFSAIGIFIGTIGSGTFVRKYLRV